MTTAELVERLKARPTGTGWLAKCPAHDDHNASLSIAEGKDGRVLLHCHAGCDIAAICEAAGMQPRDLFTEPPKATTPTQRKARTWPDAESAAKQCTPEGCTLAAVYHYRREGEPFAAVARYENATDKTFRQFSFDGDGWKAGGPSGLWPLYRADALPTEGALYVVEGERAHAAAASIGLPVVCSAGGSKAAAKTEWMPLAGRDVCILPDADKPGESYAQDVAAILGRLKARVRVVALPGLPEGGDIADYLDARDAAEPETVRAEIEALTAQVQPEAAAPWMREGISAATLAGMELREPDFIVPGMLPEGLAILASRPKNGKSWLAMGVGAAVAFGGRALSAVEVTGGRVLYLALEDGKRRLRDRLDVILQGDTAPERLHFFTQWPRLDCGGLERLQEWIAAYPDTRLIVIDTLARVKPQTSGKRNMYETDYEALAGLQALASDRTLAVLCIHHLRKAAADDVLDTLNGSSGLTGCADCILVLQRCRGEADAELHINGRDLPDAVNALDFRGGLWTLKGGAAETQSTSRKAILDALQTHGPMTPKDVAETMGRERSTIRVLLSKLTEAGLVHKTEAGLYEYKKP